MAEHIKTFVAAFEHIRNEVAIGISKSEAENLRKQNNSNTTNNKIGDDTSGINTNNSIHDKV